MAEQNLKIVIGADTRQLQSKVAQSIRILDKLKQEQSQLDAEYKKGAITADKYAQSLARITLRADRVRKATSNLRKGVQGGATSFNTFTKGAANATPTLQEFSRVIQDAPFGIIGVGNNITQLVSQFGNLSRASGGAKAAFKALGASLLGPGGVLFAVSTVVTLLTVFGDELFNTAKKSEELQKKFDGLSDSLTAELELNRAITEQRELQGKSTDALLKTRQNLITQGLEGLRIQNQAIKQELDLLAAENQRLDNVEILTGLVNKLFGIFKAIAKVSVNNAAAGLIAGATPALQFLQNVLDVEIDLSDIRAANKDDLEKERALREQFTKNTAKLVNLENQRLKIEKERQALARPEGGVQTVGDGLQAGGLTALSGGASLEGILSPFDVLIAKQNELALNSQLVGQSIGNVFNQLGQNIANSLGQTQGLFGAFVGTFIQESLRLIAQAFATSKALAVQGAAQTALAKGPGAAIVLPALIAGATALIGSAFSGIGNGGVSGAGSTGSSAVNTSFGGGGFGSGRVVFRIAGRDLIGVLNNEAAAQARIGDSSGLIPG